MKRVIANHVDPGQETRGSRPDLAQEKQQYTKGMNVASNKQKDRKLGLSYSRVSSREQAEGFSLEAQSKAEHNYAALHSITIVKEFAFVESAKEQGRKHFNDMIAYLRAHREIRVVVVEKTDRLLRNLEDFVLIEKLVKELDIEVHLIKDGQVLQKDSKSQDRLVQAIFAVIARNYVLNLQEEILKGQITKAENGQYPGRAPFGYAHDREHRTIIAHPTKAATVSLIFSLFATGSFSVKTLRRAIIDKTDDRICKSQLHRILTSRFYLGEFRWRGRVFDGTHPKLIDVATFNRVQSIVTGRSKSKPRRHDFPFSGMLTCAQDNCAVTAEQIKHRYNYYHCSFGRGRHAFPYMREERAAELLGTVFLHVNVSLDLADAIVGQSLTDITAEEAQRRKDCSMLRQRLSALETRMRKAYTQKLDNPCETEEDLWLWNSSMVEWKEEKKTIEAELQRLSEQHPVDRGFSPARIQDLASRVHEIYQTLDNSERAELLKMALCGCATDGVRIYPKYREPFGSILRHASDVN